MSDAGRLNLPYSDWSQIGTPLVLPAETIPRRLANARVCLLPRERNSYANGMTMKSSQEWALPPGTAALIFDCDGTLADTMPAHYCAWQSMLRPYGIPFPEDRFYAMGGMPTAQIIRVLAKDAGVSLNETEVERMVHCKEETFLRHLQEVRRIEPVVRIAARYRGQLPLAVASGGYRHTITRTLVHLDLLDWFDVLVTAEDTPRHKPEPDVFLEAARRLGVPPVTCVVFEDTDIGLQAASRAQMVAVDVRPWREAWWTSLRRQ